MSLEFHYDAAAQRLALRGELTIYHAAAGKAPLLEHPGADVDLSGVEELDGAGLQLLLLARRDAGARLVAASDAVAGVLRLTGLDHILEAAP